MDDEGRPIHRADAMHKDMGIWEDIRGYGEETFVLSAYRTFECSISERRIRVAGPRQHSRIISLCSEMTASGKKIRLPIKRYAHDANGNSSMVKRSLESIGICADTRRVFLVSSPLLGCLLLLLLAFTGAKTWMKKAKTHEVWTNLFHMTSY